MSIIQTVRDKGMWVVTVAIALSVIGFLLMDARSGGGQGQAGNLEDAIATVNGKKVSYGKYLEMEKMMEANYASQGRQVDENARMQIRQQVWSQLSDGTALDQEIEKLGFSLTDKEIADEMFETNPPDFLKQEFTNKETGLFDAAAARNAIAQIKKKKANDPQRLNIEKSLIDPYIENLQRKKYFGLLQASTYVPKWMAEKQIADNNAISSFQYVQVPYTAIADSTIKISDDQINKYVNAHAAAYKQEEATRSVAYINFPVAANGADSNAALASVNALKAEFETTTDPGTFTTRNTSDLPFFDGYLSQSKLMMPSKDAILAAGVGKVYGPYLDGNAWVMSRIVGVKSLPDSAKVRHILISTVDARTQQPTRDDATAKAKIDSIYTAIKAGADFGTMVLQFSEDEGSKMNGGVYEYFEQGKMVSAFNDSSFQGKVGDYKVVRTEFGYHLINILGQKGNQPAYKIAYMAKNIVPSQETSNAALTKATNFAASSRNTNAFLENAKKQNLVRLDALDIKETDYIVAGVGENRQLVRWIYENKPGTVSEPQDMKDKYVVVAITGAEPAGIPSAAKTRQAVEPILRNTEKAKLIKAKLGNITTLEAAAAAYQTQVQRADSISYASPMIPGAGPEGKVAGYAFAKANLNKVSPALEGSNGVYVIKPEMQGAKVGVASVEDIKKQMEGQIKQSIIYSAINGLHKAATITDKRSKFL
jgi:peptidyl-prolyl cis-trans isomerase D